MEVQQTSVIPIPALTDNYIWALVNHQNRNCAIVDPGDAAPVVAFLQQQELALDSILITHHHWDHTNGVMELVHQHSDTSVYGPALEPVGGMTHMLSDGDRVELTQLGLSFETLHIPGHTLGHIALYGGGMVFCGDTLFTAGCGKIFEGTAEQMHQSLSTLAALPDDTLVYCGHEYTEKNLQFALAVEPAAEAILERIKEVDGRRAQQLPTVPDSLKREKRTNPFLRTAQQSVIKAAEQYAGHSLHNEVEVLHTLREWKNREY